MLLQFKKKDSWYQETNYQSVIILPYLSKIFENIFYNKTAPHFEKNVLNIKLVFRNDLNLQMCLAAMIGKNGTALYQRGEYVVLPMDLCKTLDCLPYDLINTKSQAYSFNMVLSASIQSYLLDGYQRVLELL